MPYSVPTAGDEKTAAMPPLAPAARSERRRSGDTCSPRQRERISANDAPMTAEADSKPIDPPPATVVAAARRRPGTCSSGRRVSGW
jgi:hypothetical protein